MRVTVRTIVRLGAHLPQQASPGGQGPEVELEVPPPGDFLDLIEALREDAR